MAPISSVGLENTVLWMMLVLFRGPFYLVIQYWILSLCNKERFLPYTIGLSLMYCIATDYTLYASFYLGALLPVIIRNVNKTKIQNSVMLVLSLFLICSGVIIEEFHIVDDFYSVILVVIGFAICTNMQVVLQGRIFIELAEISFAIYLLHCYVLESVSTYLYVSIPDFLGKIFFLFIITTIFVFISSYLLYNYIERLLCHQVGRIITEMLNKKRLL